MLLAYARARGGCKQNQTEDQTNRPETEGCARAANAALETKPNQPNQTNQTHTIDGEKGHDSSFECALQLALALVAPEGGIQPQLLALIASDFIFQHCGIL